MGERGGSDRSGSGPGLAPAASRGRSPVRDAELGRRSMRDAASAWHQNGAPEFVPPPPTDPRGSMGAAENPPPCRQGYPAPEFVHPPSPDPRGSTGAAENPPEGYWRPDYWRPVLSSTYQVPAGVFGPLPCTVLAPGSFQGPEMPSGAAYQMQPSPYSLAAYLTPSAYQILASSIPSPGPLAPGPVWPIAAAPGPVRPIAAAPTYGSAGGAGAAAPVVSNLEGRRLPIWKVAIWNLSDDTTPKSLQEEISEIDYHADCIATCPGMPGAFLLWFDLEFVAHVFVTCFDGTEELKHNGTKLRAAPLHIEKRFWDVPEQISTFASHAPDWLLPSMPDSWFEGHFVMGEVEWTRHKNSALKAR